MFWATSKVKEVKFLKNQYKNLPPEMRNINRFCCWRYEKVKGKMQKVPYNPMTGRRARPNNPDTFKDFHSALTAVDNYDGIGFLVGNGICGIDLDDCFEVAGELKTVAQSVVDAFSDCYMEYSPSGKGLHIYFKATGFEYNKGCQHFSGQFVKLLQVTGERNSFCVNG